MKGLTAVLLLLLAGFCHPAAAKEPLFHVSIALIHGTVDENKGVHFDMVVEILSRVKQSGFYLEYDFYPSKRATSRLKKGISQAVYPAVISKNRTPEEWLEMGYKKPCEHSIKVWLLPDAYVILTRPDQPMLNSPKALAGKRVGVIRGLALVRDLDLEKIKNIQIDLVRDGLQNIKKLEAGRIDAAVSYRNVAAADIKRYGTTMIRPGKPFGNIHVGFTASQTPAGKLFLAAVENTVAAMVRDGTYCRILKKHKVAAHYSIVNCE